jgi:hypothetical protein
MKIVEHDISVVNARVHQTIIIIMSIVSRGAVITLTNVRMCLSSNVLLQEDYGITLSGGFAGEAWDTNAWGDEMLNVA